jgi:hypothetical protein
VPKKIIDWEELDAIFIKDNKLSYAGYEVEKSLNSAEKKSIATIKKNGATLASLESDNESAIPAHSLAVSSLDGDRLIYERFAHPFGPDAGQIVGKTDTM